ncbi:MAG: hypothetical protein SGI88_18885 [Candidatus Hydrogenedentes bacterium]|nr:hypothetical protein [Candidatus Hydrogenedentota bacterium]
MLSELPGVVSMPNADHESIPLLSEGTNPVFALVSILPKSMSKSTPSDPRNVVARITRASAGAAMFIVMQVCTGCLTTPPSSESFPVASEPKVVLQPGDVLQVKFLYWPELNEEKQAIRPVERFRCNLLAMFKPKGAPRMNCAPNF